MREQNSCRPDPIKIKIKGDFMAISKNARTKVPDKPLCKFCKNPINVAMQMPGRKMIRYCCEEAKKTK